MARLPVFASVLLFILTYSWDWEDYAHDDDFYNDDGVRVLGDPDLRAIVEYDTPDNYHDGFAPVGDCAGGEG